MTKWHRIKEAVLVLVLRSLILLVLTVVSFILAVFIPA